MAARVKVNNLIKFFILLALNNPKHGYGIIKELERSLNRKISASQIYPFLNQLKKNDYVRVRIYGKKKIKKIYTLTNEGKKFVNSLLTRLGIFIDAAIKARLKKCAHCNCEIYSEGYKKKFGKKKLIFCCKYCAKAFSNRD